MTTAGPNSPSSVTTTQVGFFENVPWSDPGNATTSDDSYATVTLARNDLSFALRCTDFGFTNSDVPLGATIVGIVVEVEVSQDGVAGNAGSPLVYGGSQISDPAVAGFTPDGTDTYWSLGSPTDTRDVSVTQDMVVDASFGIDLYFGVGFDGFNSTVSVDHVRMTIYYSGAPGIAEGDATISGSSTVSATGASIKSGSGSVSGVASATGAGAAIKGGASTIAGTAAASGAGARVLGGAASIAGSALLAAIAASFAGASATASGAATVTAVGSSIKAGAASAAGSATVTAPSGLILGGAGTFAGSAAATGVGAAIVAGAGAASGSATVAGAGASIASGDAAIAAASSLLGAGGIHLPAPSWRTATATVTSRRVNAGGRIRTVDAGRSA